MHPDLVALLALQEDDDAIAALEEQRRALDAQLQTLDRERATTVEALARARESVDGEEKRRRDLVAKVQDHKVLQDRNLATLDAVRKAREAAAAMAQIDLTRKVLAQEEAELQTLSARLVELRQTVEGHERALAELDQRQQVERGDLAARAAALDAQIGDARRARETAAAKVSRPVLAKYERIRGRSRSTALFALRGAACGRCNTAVPLQLRNVMAAGRSIEVCEGCGVLLYATG